MTWKSIKIRVQLNDYSRKGSGLYSYKGATVKKIKRKASYVYSEKATKFEEITKKLSALSNYFEDNLDIS